LILLRAGDLVNIKRSIFKNQGGFVTKMLLFVGILMSAFAAQAMDGSSGCGPGWFLFKDESLVSSSLRSTTDGVLWPTVTGGMTSGTSNCSKHSIVREDKESLHFATMNYYEIKGEIARGEGPFLTSFGSTLGCSGEVRAHLNQTLKENYRQIFPSSEVSPEHAVDEIHKVIQQDQLLSQQCAV